MAGSVLCLAPTALALAAETKPIQILFEKAIRQVEDEAGRKISINPIVISAQTQNVGSFGLSAVSMMCNQDGAGLKFATADRRGATDAEWKEAVAILAALIAPEGSLAEKQAAVAQLLDARAHGRTLAKKISNSWIVASATTDAGESWFAFQRGYTLNGRAIYEPPPAIGR